MIVNNLAATEVRAGMTARMIYLLLAVIAAMSYAILGFSENYIALITGKDTFYSDLFLLLAFSSLFFFGILQFLRGLFSSISRPQRLVFSSAILVCFAASFYFRDELLLGDRSFFALNKSEFAIGIGDGVIPTPTVVFQRSSYNFIKLFVYAGSVQLGEGPVSQPTLVTVLGYREQGLRGCDVVARKLSGRFHVLSGYC